MDVNFLSQPDENQIFDTIRAYYILHHVYARLVLIRNPNLQFTQYLHNCTEFIVGDSINKFQNVSATLAVQELYRTYQSHDWLVQDHYISNRIYEIQNWGQLVVSAIRTYLANFLDYWWLLINNTNMHCKIEQKWKVSNVPKLLIEIVGIYQIAPERSIRQLSRK